MRLNPDCIRDILLTVEEISDSSTHVGFKRGKIAEYSRLDDYSDEEVFYHLNQCDLSGFFTKTIKDMTGNCTVLDLSPRGHEFLANIRKDKVWGGVKKIAGTIGATSLSALTQIASNVITELIKSQFGLSVTPTNIL